ncbi:MAG: AmmeMemoRadiSam system protein B [Planctomycetes bacterium GWF2_50_10]|nr:MAG: AmmeMemoRadiSam system protein B [Planctomycetes bacterium GWF2_50_10]
MDVRKAAVAGQFYPGKKVQCEAELAEFLAARKAGAVDGEIVAGIVPHAGWMFSGDVAGQVFNTIKRANGEVDTFVIFGAVHWPFGRGAAVYNRGRWVTPLGDAQVDEEAAEAIIAANAGAEANLEAHQFEHSIEVQVPFIQYLWPGAKIVPVMVGPEEFAVEFGRDGADGIKKLSEGGKKIVIIGSTDLTHYGPRYGFDPKGVGAKAIAWAKDVNDMEFINYALNMRAEQILHTALANQNACGAGAAAATVAAAARLGKSKGVLLAHTHSNEVMEKRFGESSEESVGYAGIVF